MSLEQVASTLWKHRILFAVAVVLLFGAVAAVTFSLPKQYKTTATLFVGVSPEVNEALAFDTNIGEQLARTYTTLSANPNVADSVLRELPFSLTRSELLEKMSFAPVERTQLLEVTAEAESRERAQVLANTYADVFVRRVNDQFERGDTQTRIVVNERAALPARASSPNPPLYLGFGLVLALLLALVIVLLRERLDDRIHVTADDTEVLGEPIIARIPALSRRGEPDPQVADAFRLLKANFDLFHEGPARVVMVTSGSPVEGKSTVTASLAVTAAADGERVALVEADLRRPGLAATAAGQGAERAEVGLTSYLVGVADEHEAGSPHPRIPGLTVFWSGPLPPNPGSMLRSARFETLMESLREDYDRVFVDTSPISVGADATVLVPRVDGVLFVVDATQTRRSHAQAGLNQLRTAQARILGVVLNRAPVQNRQSYGYYAVAPDLPAPSARR